MAITNNQMAEAGFVAAQTILIRQLMIEAAAGAVAGKPEIAALTSSSTAADIVAALKA